jgi:hypothetical protein
MKMEEKLNDKHETIINPKNITIVDNNIKYTQKSIKINKKIKTIPLSISIYNLIRTNPFTDLDSIVIIYRIQDTKIELIGITNIVINSQNPSFNLNLPIVSNELYRFDLYDIDNEILINEHLIGSITITGEILLSNTEYGTLITSTNVNLQKKLNKKSSMIVFNENNI